MCVWGSVYCGWGGDERRERGDAPLGPVLVEVLWGQGLPLGCVPRDHSSTLEDFLGKRTPLGAGLLMGVVQAAPWDRIPPKRLFPQERRSLGSWTAIWRGEGSRDAGQPSPPET